MGHIIKAENIDAIMIRRSCFAVEAINAAARAEIMPRDFGVPAIFTEVGLSGDEFKIIFMDFHHQRIFLYAKRAIASRELGKVAGDFKLHIPAMAGA